MPRICLTELASCALVLRFFFSFIFFVVFLINLQKKKLFCLWKIQMMIHNRNTFCTQFSFLLNHTYIWSSEIFSPDETCSCCLLSTRIGCGSCVSVFGTSSSSSLTSCSLLSLFFSSSSEFKFVFSVSM